MADIKWTQELRNIVYARITMEFGALNSWEGARYPRGQRERYNKVLEELAKYLTSLTGEEFAGSAVEQQVSWAITSQEQVAASHARQYIMNKAAALEMGFLAGRDLPDQISTSPEETRWTRSGPEESGPEVDHK